MTSNRDRALTAAIEILADEGVRALTHRRVDERAGLPQGSASNAFRTREALLLGITERMAGAELPAVSESLAAGSPEELADALHELFAQQVGPLRTQTAARLALFVEAGHDDAIRAALGRGRSVVVEPLRSAFAALGAPDPDLAVHLVASCFEGLFLHALGRRADLDPRPVITAAVRGALIG
ncbi:TetR/AcrR family transcriptional regulator [Leucobacter sp.]